MRFLTLLLAVAGLCGPVRAAYSTHTAEDGAAVDLWDAVAGKLYYEGTLQGSVLIVR